VEKAAGRKLLKRPETSRTEHWGNLPGKVEKKITSTPGRGGSHEGRNTFPAGKEGGTKECSKERIESGKRRQGPRSLRAKASVLKTRGSVATKEDEFGRGWRKGEWTSISKTGRARRGGQGYGKGWGTEGGLLELPRNNWETAFWHHGAEAGEGTV